MLCYSVKAHGTGIKARGSGTGVGQISAGAGWERDSNLFCGTGAGRHMKTVAGAGRERDYIMRDGTGAGQKSGPAQGSSGSLPVICSEMHRKKIIPCMGTL